MKYPLVLDEVATINKAIAQGLSIARFGDGDFNVMRGRFDLYQKHDASLAYALASCLVDPEDRVLNCIPRAFSVGELGKMRWEAFVEANSGLFPMLGRHIYGSSYISRMDSVPEIHTEAYWRCIARLWHDKNIVLVRGSEKSLTRVMLENAPLPPASVIEIKVPLRDGWAASEQTLAAVEAERVKVVIVCAGLMSRPLTHRLTARGYIVYDLGHLGMYFDRGVPRPLSECR